MAARVSDTLRGRIGLPQWMIAALIAQGAVVVALVSLLR